MPCSTRDSRGQIALEFMVLLAVVLMLFVIVIFIYASNVHAGGRVGSRLAATQLCLQVSATLTSVASLGGDSAYAFSLPPHLNYRNYSVWVVSEGRRVVVNYETEGGPEAGATCALHAAGITDSNGSTLFRLGENTTIINEGGIVHVEP